MMVQQKDIDEIKNPVQKRWANFKHTWHKTSMDEGHSNLFK